jgi:ABC-type sugar transport system ATPase subunit
MSNTPTTESAPVIAMRGISKSFGAIRALHDVSLHLMPGEILGLVGDNSAGKSTRAPISATRARSSSRARTRTSRARTSPAPAASR